MTMEIQEVDGIRNCVIKLRENSQKRRDKVYIGCGAGFGGDRPFAALKLLQRVKELNYIVLECLAERTLAERYQVMVSGGDGYDSRISDWMRLLLPLAVERGTCIITNMGAMDPHGAQEKVIEIASSLGLSVSVAVAYEISVANTGSGSSHEKSYIMEGGISTYLGAAPIVECLEKYQPNVIITSRVADAALFLAPMIYELGWNWDSLEQLAQGSLAGHLLECGCQLTGGYFMHPGDKSRNMSFSQLLDLSLPYAEISSDGKVFVAKAEGTGGVLNFSTCAEQLLYEVGDPGAYITPDVIIDIRDVSFYPLSSCKVLCAGAKPSAVSVPDKLLRLVPKDYGWKGWGEISYGGYECVKRAKAAEFLVKREHVLWRTAVKHTTALTSNICLPHESGLSITQANEVKSSTNSDSPFIGSAFSPAPSGHKIPLYDVAHVRAGDKGNDLNFSMIPHFPPDIVRLKSIITPQWVKKVVSALLNSSPFPDMDAINERDKWVNENVKVEIYEVKGIRSLNVVVRDILDGGVNCSRRIDRHGKTISDLILCQQVLLPPWLGRSNTLIA
ncbi:uncharacterized protein LOC117618494 isoform X2 [Prunus dulcis]|uniref:uncharacterized protein LOC117618494 isoform X2 n=1 Tax=Prunus dulcis TaxID=3755 RepID=UPI001483CDA7|nr:uncharacterized protein LOC117618494 isoform X2 [Prunus dulcis]